MPDDNESLVLVPRDYTDIAKLREPNILDQLRERPIATALEIVTGAAAGGAKGLFVSMGRIAQSILKADLQYGVIAEMKRLSDAGRIPEDIGRTKYGAHTWAEFMKIIDDDPPDADRLEALKAAFYAVNKVDAGDAQRVVAYRLWQVAKRLDSGDVMLLKAMYEAAPNLDSTPTNQWHQRAAEKSGLGIGELVGLSESHLRDLRLIKETGAVGGSVSVITNLGRQIVQSIQTYKLDLERSARGTEERK